MLSTIRRPVVRNLGQLILFFLATGLTACGNGKFGNTPEWTGLTGATYHTGTLTVLRVDDAWHIDHKKRGLYSVGHGIQKKRSRFVPLRGKTDIAGLDGPDRVVTKDDLITITLNSAFIKFFQQLGEETASGEIAVVLSFSAGSTVQENLLIHSSRGQTLGSFLDLQDWPVAGPVQIDGDSLLIRIVIIELNQRENVQNSQTVRALAGIGTTFSPGLAPLFSITQQIADFVISQNSDDVILDQKFSLQRVDSSLPATRSPLLFGKYILLMQEDKFVSRDLNAVAPLSTLPPRVDDMRYDMEFDRVAIVYSYFPEPKLKNGECSTDQAIDVHSEYRPTFLESMYEGKGYIDYDSFFPQPDNDSDIEESGPDIEESDSSMSEPERTRCILKKFVNGMSAMEVRKSELGYREPIIGERELKENLDHAFKTAYLQGIRHFPSAQKEIEEFDSQLANLFGKAKPSGRIPFNYYITQYPEAYTLVAQYPLHTHLVFSIDRSLGGDGEKFHERFQTFIDFINNELQSTRDTDRIGALTIALDGIVRTRRSQQALLRSVDRMKPQENDEQEAERFAQQRVCVLWQNGLQKIPNPDNPEGKATDTLLSNAPVYNEIFHITGQYFSNRNEVAKYLDQKGWGVDRDNHTCTHP